MTFHGPLVRRLGPSHARTLEDFLRRDSVAFIYPLGWLVRDGVAPRVHYLEFCFLGAFRGRELVGAAMLAGSVLLFVATRDPEVAQALAVSAKRQPEPFRVIVGPRDGVQAAWAALEEQGCQARLRRPQIVYATGPAELVRLDEPALRLAEPRDFERVFRATLEMHEHETLEKPSRRDLPNFRRSVEYQIRLHRIHLLDPPDGGRDLRFKAAVSVLCDAGAQLEGVYVPLAHRRMGHARRCLSTLCQRLFKQTEVVSLYVNADNQPAIDLYERSLGFHRALDYETVFLAR